MEKLWRAQGCPIYPATSTFAMSGRTTPSGNDTSNHPRMHASFDPFCGGEDDDHDVAEYYAQYWAAEDDEPEEAAADDPSPEPLATGACVSVMC